MKFLCENCKAKYQIGDDKVAGKTVRMKCRRCGFDIHVNASTIVDEASAASWPDASATMQGSMAIITPEAAAAMGLRPATSAAATSAPVAPSPPRATPAPLGAPRPAGVLGLSPSAGIPRAVPAPRPLAPSMAAAPSVATAPALSSIWPANPADLEEESTAVMSVPLRVAVAAAQAATSAGTPRPPMGSTALPTRDAALPRPAPAPAPAPRPAGPPRPAVAAAPRARPPGSPLDSPTSSNRNLNPSLGGAAGVTGVLGRALEEQPDATTTHPMAAAPQPAAAPAPKPAPAPPAAAPTHSDGWYVGVAGTPLGPTNLTVIREKARTGEIHPDSLVWRDGQGEWVPLRNFSELLEAVNGVTNVNAAIGAATSVNAAIGAATSVNSANAARVASLASNVLAATPTPAPYTAADEPSSPAAATPSPNPSLESVSSISAFSSPTGRGSAATAVLTDIFPARGSNPFDAPEPAHPSAPTSASQATHPILDPFGAPQTDVVDTEVLAGLALATAPSKAPSVPDSAAGGFASGAGGPPIEIDESVVPRRRAPLHPMAYAFIAFAAVFGGVAAYVLLSKPQQIVVVQTGPIVGVTSSDAKIEKPAATTEVAVGEPTTDATGAAIVRPNNVPGVGGPRPKGSSTAVAAPIDTTGFTSTIPGPSTAQAPPPSGAGSQLSQGEIQGVVAQNQSIVKRKCWQPALESRATNAPTTARVNGAITIGASGNVESASASGGERDFPGLSSCIASRMKGWKFPPSGSSTPVNVPFVFAGQ